MTALGMGRYCSILGSFNDFFPDLCIMQHGMINCFVSDELGMMFWWVDVVYFYIDHLFHPMRRVIEESPEISYPPDLGHLHYEVDVLATQLW